MQQLRQQQQQQPPQQPPQQLEERASTSSSRRLDERGSASSSRPYDERGSASSGRPVDERGSASSGRPHEERLSAGSSRPFDERGSGASTSRPHEERYSVGSSSAAERSTTDSMGNVRTEEDGAPWMEMQQLDSPEHRLLKALPAYVSHLKADLAAAVTTELLTDAEAAVTDMDALPSRVSSTILRMVLAPRALAQAERHTWGHPNRTHSYSSAQRATQRPSLAALQQTSSSISGALPTRAISLPHNLHRPRAGPSLLGPQPTRVLQPMQLSATGVQPLPALAGPAVQTHPGAHGGQLISNPMYSPTAAHGYSALMQFPQHGQPPAQGMGAPLGGYRTALTTGRVSRDGSNTSDSMSISQAPPSGSSQQLAPQLGHDLGMGMGEHLVGMRVVSEGGMWPITSRSSSPMPGGSWVASSGHSTPTGQGPMHPLRQPYSPPPSLLSEQPPSDRDSRDSRGMHMAALQHGPPLPMPRPMPQPARPLQVLVSDPAAATPGPSLVPSSPNRFALEPGGPPPPTQLPLPTVGPDTSVFAYQHSPLGTMRSAGGAGSSSGGAVPSSSLLSGEGDRSLPPLLEPTSQSSPNMERPHSFVALMERPSGAFTERSSQVSITDRPSTAYITDRPSTAYTDRTSLTERMSGVSTSGISGYVERPSWADNVSTSSGVSRSSTVHGSAASLPMYRRQPPHAKDEPGGAARSPHSQHKAAATWDAVSPALHRDVQLLQAQAAQVSLYPRSPRSVVPSPDLLVQSSSGGVTSVMSTLGSPSAEAHISGTISGTSNALSKLTKTGASECGTEEADLSSLHLTSMPSSSLSNMGTPGGSNRPRSSKSFDLAEASGSKAGETAATASASAGSGYESLSTPSRSPHSVVDKGVQVGGLHDDIAGDTEGRFSAAHALLSATGVATLDEGDDDDSNPEEDVGKEVLLLLKRYYPQLAQPLHALLAQVVSEQELLRVAAAARSQQPRVLERVACKTLETIVEEHAQLKARVQELEAQQQQAGIASAMAGAASGTPPLPPLPHIRTQTQSAPSSSAAGSPRFASLQVRALALSAGKSSSWAQAKREALAAAGAASERSSAATVGGGGAAGSTSGEQGSLSQSSSSSANAACMVPSSSSGNMSIPLNLLLSNRLDGSVVVGAGDSTARASDAGTDITFAARSLPGSSANSSGRRTMSASGAAQHSSSSDDAPGAGLMSSPRMSLNSLGSGHLGQTHDSLGGSGTHRSSSSSSHFGSARNGSSSGSLHGGSGQRARMHDEDPGTVNDSAAGPSGGRRGLRGGGDSGEITPGEITPAPGGVSSGGGVGPGGSGAEDPEPLGSPSASGASVTASSISFRPGAALQPLQGTPPGTWGALVARSGISGTGSEHPQGLLGRADSPGGPHSGGPLGGQIGAPSVGTVTVASWDNVSRLGGATPGAALSDQEVGSTSSGENSPEMEGRRGRGLPRCWPTRPGWCRLA